MNEEMSVRETGYLHFTIRIWILDTICRSKLSPRWSLKTYTSSKLTVPCENGENWKINYRRVWWF